MIHLLLALNAICFTADTTPILGWNKQLFPSFLIGTATMSSATEPDDSRLGDPDGMLGISAIAPHDKTPIRVTILCDGFMEPSTFAGTLEHGGKTYQVYPKIKYRFDRLGRCLQSTPATITIQVQIGSEVLEHSSTITFRSIHDCPSAIRSNDRDVDISYTLATYVNEQHPYVDMLLREALDIGIVEGFVGYQSQSDADVMRQVYAIWDLLVARDMRIGHVASTAVASTAVASTAVKSRPVRLLEETINNQQATSLDGSVLFVSLLRKIGIEASFVMAPGQNYVAFYLDEKHTKQFGIETKYIGIEFETPTTVPADLQTSLPDELRDDLSWPSFVMAFTTATESLRQNRELFDDPKNSEYQKIDIENARRMGVLPIPFASKERFVAFDHSVSSEEEMAETTTATTTEEMTDATNESDEDPDDSEEE